MSVAQLEALWKEAVTEAKSSGSKKTVSEKKNLEKISKELWSSSVGPGLKKRKLVLDGKEGEKPQKNEKLASTRHKMGEVKQKIVELSLQLEQDKLEPLLAELQPRTEKKRQTPPTDLEALEAHFQVSAISEAKRLLEEALATLETIKTGEKSQQTQLEKVKNFEAFLADMKQSAQPE
jgi:hypothetical protein